MIDRLDARALRSLAEPRTAPCVTLLLPTEHGPRGAEAARLGLKNLVAAARDELDQQMPSLAVQALLEPVETMLADEAVWHELGEGLACFLAPDLPGGLVATVPRPAAPRWSVADRFVLTPLLGGYFPDACFHVLALSRNHTQVFTGDRHSFRPVHVPDLPDGVEDALWYESTDNLLNRHAGGRVDAGGRPMSVVHGGAASDTRKEQFDRYARAVDDAIVAALGGSRLPLVVAAVEREIAAYHEATRYPDVVTGGVTAARTARRSGISTQRHGRSWPGGSRPCSATPSSASGRGVAPARPRPIRDGWPSWPPPAASTCCSSPPARSAGPAATAGSAPSASRGTATSSTISSSTPCGPPRRSCRWPIWANWSPTAIR